MTGLEEFKKIFGNITVLNVLELALAVAFVIFLYKKGKKYILAKNAEDEEKSRQLKTALDAVSKYPEYRAQSIKIQRELQSAIDELRKSQDANTAKLQSMEADQNRSERNRLRDQLIKSYSFYTNKEKNPDQTWNRMEAEAFWEMFAEYEKRGGNGYVHTVIHPAMTLLRVVEVGELHSKGDPRKKAET